MPVSSLQDSLTPHYLFFPLVSLCIYMVTTYWCSQALGTTYCLLDTLVTVNNLSLNPLQLKTFECAICFPPGMWLLHIPITFPWTFSSFLPIFFPLSLCLVYTYIKIYQKEVILIFAIDEIFIYIITFNYMTF